jgi:hypothetical protein
MAADGDLIPEEDLEAVVLVVPEPTGMSGVMITEQ